MYSTPVTLSNDTLAGLTVAVRAGPPSPVELAVPVPANATMVPLGHTRRTLRGRY